MIDEPVLIVDDQRHIRTYMRLVCEKRLGRTVVEAEDAEIALRFCEKNVPGLILLDVNMPRMNGVVALAKLRARLPCTPIIMLTVRASRSVVRDCLLAGATFYLRKDTPIDQIYRVLQQCLQASSDREETAKKRALVEATSA